MWAAWLVNCWWCYWRWSLANKKLACEGIIPIYYPKMAILLLQLLVAISVRCIDCTNQQWGQSNNPSLFDYHRVSYRFLWCCIFRTEIRVHEQEPSFWYSGEPWDSSGGSKNSSSLDGQWPAGEVNSCWHRGISPVAPGTCGCRRFQDSELTDPHRGPGVSEKCAERERVQVRHSSYQPVP